MDRGDGKTVMIDVNTKKVEKKLSGLMVITLDLIDKKFKLYSLNNFFPLD